MGSVPDGVECVSDLPFEGPALGGRGPVALPSTSQRPDLLIIIIIIIKVCFAYINDDEQ